MKTLILAAIRCSLIFTAVTALSLAYPTSLHAVPTTYRYAGNPFNFAIRPYTTTDFVTVMFTLAGSPASNIPLRADHARRFHILRWSADHYESSPRNAERFLVLGAEAAGQIHGLGELFVRLSFQMTSANR